MNNEQALNVARVQLHIEHDDHGRYTATSAHDPGLFHIRATRDKIGGRLERWFNKYRAVRGYTWTFGADWEKDVYVVVRAPTVRPEHQVDVTAPMTNSVDYETRLGSMIRFERMQIDGMLDALVKRRGELKNMERIYYEGSARSINMFVRQHLYPHETQEDFEQWAASGAPDRVADKPLRDE